MINPQSKIPQNQDLRPILNPLHAQNYFADRIIVCPALRSYYEKDWQIWRAISGASGSRWIWLERVYFGNITMVASPIGSFFAAETAGPLDSEIITDVSFSHGLVENGQNLLHFNVLAGNF
jgi:hypothetical protein